MTPWSYEQAPSIRLRCVSLGAGVQSTTMVLMAAHGEIEPMPDCAIFADTMSEPLAVYEHLRWLMSSNVLPFPVHIVSKGSLKEKILSASAGRRRNDGRPPLFIKNPDGSRGILKRQCTTDYKIDPIEKKVRELLGLRRGQRWPKEPVVEQWIGISSDEVIRLKDSRRPAVVRRHPLLERWMSRRDCYRWLEKHGYPKPPKSACTFCPFHDDGEWRRIFAVPEDKADALAVDEAIRSKPYRGLVGEGYLHQSLVPLAQIDFSKSTGHSQPDFFGECEGVCGV